MTIKIAFDFDGICTDPSFIIKEETNKFEYLLSPFSTVISTPRNGVYELASIFGLFAELSIISSRPPEATPYIKDWLARNNLLHLFKYIHCYGDSDKRGMIQGKGIVLTIEGNQKHLDSPTENLKNICWADQTWLALTGEIFEFLISTNSVFINDTSKSFLTSFDNMTDLGSSTVFILTFSDRSKLKLRVCYNEEIKVRIINFLTVANTKKYKHVSKVVASNGRAILKRYLEGIPISYIKETERLPYIYKTGSALAKLHRIKVEKPISEINFHMDKKSNSLLVFSADNFNIIITPQNDVAFVDLEACNSGSRWIDFYWCQQLLCKNDEERKTLLKGYFAIYKGKKPTDKEIYIARINFKIWLSYQLQNSKLFHALDTEKVKIIDDILSRTWA